MLKSGWLQGAPRRLCWMPSWWRWTVLTTTASGPSRTFRPGPEARWLRTRCVLAASSTADFESRAHVRIWFLTTGHESQMILLSLGFQDLSTHA